MKMLEETSGPGSPTLYFNSTEWDEDGNEISRKRFRQESGLKKD
jgi:hypothetical protein